MTAHSVPADTRSIDRPMLIYWALATLIGTPLLWDLLTVWNLPRTLSQPGMLLLLSATFVFSQLMYAAVARHSGRPIRFWPTLLFAVGNGIAETLAFAAVFRVGMWLGAALVGLVVPAWAAAAGFAVGVAAFVLYGGLIHALFWLPLLPPHLDDSPRSLRIRQLRPLAEIGLVLGWSLCFWLFHDIWTVVVVHVFVDLGLMLLVRPQVFSLSQTLPARAA
jgi:chlorophyllide a hydrolase